MGKQKITAMCLYTLFHLYTLFPLLWFNLRIRRKYKQQLSCTQYNALKNIALESPWPSSADVLSLFYFWRVFEAIFDEEPLQRKDFTLRPFFEDKQSLPSVFSAVFSLCLFDNKLSEPWAAQKRREAYEPTSINININTCKFAIFALYRCSTSAPVTSSNWLLFPRVPKMKVSWKISYRALATSTRRSRFST